MIGAGAGRQPRMLLLLPLPLFQSLALDLFAWSPCFGSIADWQA
jgi:hypothetical protein